DPQPPRRPRRRRSGPPWETLGRPPKWRHLASRPCAARTYGVKSREKLRHRRHSFAPQGLTTRDRGLRPGDPVPNAPGGRPLRWGRPAPRRSGSPRVQRRLPQPLSPPDGDLETDSHLSDRRSYQGPAARPIAGDTWVALSANHRAEVPRISLAQHSTLGRTFL